jgi:hypothetical protein
MNNYQTSQQQYNAHQQPYYPQQQHKQQQYNGQQPSTQPTVIIVKSNSSNKSVLPGVYGCFASMFLTPIISLFALCCVTNPRHRALIILTSGIGGLVWLAVFFPVGAIYDVASRVSSCGYDYDVFNSYPYNDDHDFGSSYYNITSSPYNNNDTVYVTASYSPSTSTSYSSVAWICKYPAAFRAVAITMFVIGGLFALLDIVLICMGSVQIHRINDTSRVGPYANELSAETLEAIRRTQQQPTQQVQQLPPPYLVPAGALAIPVNQMSGGSRSHGSQMSLETMAVHLNIPGLLNVSLADALEMDFKRLKESCAITEEEYLRLKRFKSSTQ